MARRHFPRTLAIALTEDGRVIGLGADVDGQVVPFAPLQGPQPLHETARLQAERIEHDRQAKAGLAYLAEDARCRRCQTWTAKVELDDAGRCPRCQRS